MIYDNALNNTSNSLNTYLKSELDSKFTTYNLLMNSNLNNTTGTVSMATKEICC